MSEKILVFSEEVFNEIGRFSGFSKDADKFLKNEQWLKSLHYVDRAWAETTERIKQVISYDLIEQSGSIFVYQRSPKGGEDRLHGLYSLGIGGHSSLSDAASCPLEAFNNGRFRELEEEIGLTPPFDSIMLGCIYDGSNSVGKVHWGLCHKVTIPVRQKIIATEDAIANGDFWTVNEIKANKGRFESWSQILINEVL